MCTDSGISGLKFQAKTNSVRLNKTKCQSYPSGTITPCSTPGGGKAAEKGLVEKDLEVLVNKG